MDLRAGKKGMARTADDASRIKTWIVSWAYGSIQIWKKSPVYFLGSGLALIFLFLLPGINILALVASGVVLGLFFQSLNIIEEGETVSFDKLDSSLRPLAGYLVLIQIINILVFLLLTAVHWFAALLVVPFILFTIPLAMEEPMPLSELLERSFQIGRDNYLVLLALTLLLFSANYLIYAFIPILLFISLPYSFIMIYLSFRELERTTEKVNRKSASLLTS
jgi:hypothetical protein